MNRHDLEVHNSMHDVYHEEITECYSTGVITVEEFNKLRSDAINMHQKLNYMVNYLESRLVQLKGDLAEAKVFDTSVKEAIISARLQELEVLIEAGSLDSVV